MANQTPLPFEEEAKLLGAVVQFFTARLPHAVCETVEHFDAATLSKELFEDLSARGDEELAELGIGRDELSRVAAAASGLLAGANNPRYH